LAKGSTSEILLVCHAGPLGFERLVVLKLLLPDLRDSARARDAMLCEAAAYARVSHPAIVRLYDFIEHERRLGIVLEHVDGLALNELRAQLHQRGERLSDTASLYAASRLFAALSAAHAARNSSTGEFTPVIHADVGPSNVLVPWDGYVKLTDFGSARVAGMVDRAAAPAVHPYLAPEQARGREISPRTDVYSGCLLLWELLTHRRAIAPDQPSTGEMLREIARPKVPPLASLRPDLPLPLVSIVDAGIEPKAERRHVAAAEVFAVLRESTDLEAARTELAEVMGRLRRPPHEAEAFESTPETPEAEASPSKTPSPWRGNAISATFWLADDSESTLPLDITVVDESASGTPALGDPDTTPTSGGSPRTDPPVMLTKKPELRPSPVHRARAVIALAAAVAALAVASITTAMRLARKHEMAVVFPAAQGPMPATQRVATTDPASTRAALETSATPSTTPAPSVAPSEASCSGPGWVVVPPSRAGHRVWIDGRLVGGSPGRFPVSSGGHVVRVGSQGVARTVVVGCAEEQVVAR
jgi:serine/threonine protein kinase